MTFPPLYILRHGQTVWNAEHRIQGRLDSDLTAQGRAQAAAQNRLLRALDLSGFVAISSPQGRAWRTAQIALEGLGLELRGDARLAEIGVGDWEGRLRQDLPGAGPVDETEESALGLYERAPGGEGFAALEARCASFLADLPGPAVLITHGVTSRMLRVISQGLTRDALGQLEGGQGVIFEIRAAQSRRLG